MQCDHIILFVPLCFGRWQYAFQWIYKGDKSPVSYVNAPCPKHYIWSSVCSLKICVCKEPGFLMLRGFPGVFLGCKVIPCAPFWRNCRAAGEGGNHSDMFGCLKLTARNRTYSLMCQGDHIGQLKDKRDWNCDLLPTSSHLSKRPGAELKELLIKAIEGQIQDLLENEPRQVRSRLAQTVLGLTQMSRFTNTFFRSFFLCVRAERERKTQITTRGGAHSGEKDRSGKAEVIVTFQVSASRSSMATVTKRWWRCIVVNGCNQLLLENTCHVRSLQCTTIQIWVKQ